MNRYALALGKKPEELPKKVKPKKKKKVTLNRVLRSKDDEIEASGIDLSELIDEPAGTLRARMEQSRRSRRSTSAVPRTPRSQTLSIRCPNGYHVAIPLSRLGTPSPASPSRLDTLTFVLGVTECRSILRDIRAAQARISRESTPRRQRPRVSKGHYFGPQIVMETGVWRDDSTQDDEFFKAMLAQPRLAPRRRKK